MSKVSNSPDPINPSINEGRVLFRCFGIGYAHSSPEHIYPVSRCLGFKGRSDVDYSIYNRRDSSLGDHTNHFKPITESLITTNHLHPTKPLNRKEDICIGSMSIDIDAVVRCRGLGIEVAFDEEKNEDEQEFNVFEKQLTNQRFSQEMIPPAMDTRNEIEFDRNEIDEEANDDEAVNVITKDKLVDEFKTGIGKIPSVVHKVGQRAFLLSSTSFSLVGGATASALRNKKDFLGSMYQRFMEIENRSIEVCWRSWLGVKNLVMGKHPPS